MGAPTQPTPSEKKALCAGAAENPRYCTSVNALAPAHARRYRSQKPDDTMLADHPYGFPGPGVADIDRDLATDCAASRFRSL
jgi:hypothetical protein